MSILTPLLLTLAPALAPGHAVPSVPQGPVAEAARGAGFHAELVPADALFVGFVDVAKLRSSDVGALWKSPMAAEKRGEVIGELGFDPMEECSALYAYATKPEDGSAVFVLEASDVIDTLVGAMVEQEKLSFTEYEGQELLQIEDGFAAIEPAGAGRRVVMAEDPALVLHGLALLRGEGATLADEAADLHPGSDSFLYACTRAVPDEALEFQPASRMLRLVQSGSFELGQRDADLIALLQFQAEDEAKARNAADIARGTLALARLAGGEDIPAQVLDLLDALRIRTRGNSIAIDFAYPFADLMALAQSLSDEG